MQRLQSAYASFYSTFCSRLALGLVYSCTLSVVYHIKSKFYTKKNEEKYIMTVKSC